MNEEDLKLGTDGASGELRSEESAETLENELEALKETFQTVLNETTAEAQEEPVIQELDYQAEEPSQQSSEAAADDENTQTDKKSGKKDKKKKKKIPAAAIIIPVVLCVLIIVPLLAYFIITVKEPDFNKFLKAYSTAGAGTEAAEKVSAYEEALTYCTDESILASFKQTILENIVLAKCEAEGYQAAYSYMTENMTDEMIAAPEKKEFKDFLKIGGHRTLGFQIGELSNGGLGLGMYHTGQHTYCHQ